LVGRKGNNSYALRIEILCGMDAKTWYHSSPHCPPPHDGIIPAIQPNGIERMLLFPLPTRLVLQLGPILNSEDQLDEVVSGGLVRQLLLYRPSLLRRHLVRTTNQGTKYGTIG